MVPFKSLLAAFMADICTEETLRLNMNVIIANKPYTQHTDHSNNEP